MFFDASYFINLDARTDRKKKFFAKAAAAGLPNPIRFPAIPATNEECLPDIFNQGNKRKYKVSCSKSHIGVVQEAKAQGLKSVLIFEDDCVFLDGFMDTAKQCFSELQHLNWNVMYFGGEPNNHCTPVSENVYTITNGGVYCCHAYAVNHTYYDRILAINPYTVDVIDIALLNHSIHIRNFMLSKKMVAVQEDFDFSELEQHNQKAASQTMKNGWERFVTNSVHNPK